MKKHRLIGWLLTIAMLAGMLPAGALAAPVTQPEVSKYVTLGFEKENVAKGNHGLLVSVYIDNEAKASTRYQFVDGPGATTVESANAAYTIDRMLLNDSEFTSGAPITLTEEPSALDIYLEPAWKEGDVPIINWQRSKEIGTGNAEVLKNPPVKKNVDNATWSMLKWKWSDISKIKTSVTGDEAVWDAQIGREHYFSGYLKSRGAPQGTVYPAATWSCGPNAATLRRFKGEFTIPPKYSTRDTYRLRSVNSNSGEYLPINDDIYIFVYQDETDVTDDNFMDYLAFWSGTSTRKKFGTVYSNDRKGTVAYQDGKYKIPVTDNWYCEANIDNIGNVMYANYPEAETEETFIIDIFCFDNSRNGGGGMEKLTIDVEKTTDLAATIRYWKDKADVKENYIGKKALKGLEKGAIVRLEDEDLNARKPGEFYSDGVQQNAPYVVQEDNGFIDVVYTYTGATVKYDLNLPQGVTAPDGVTAPADVTVQMNSPYKINTKPIGLKNDYVDIGDKRYTFKGWGTEKDSKDHVDIVLVDKDPTTLYGIWETSGIPVEVRFVAGEHGEIAIGEIATGQKSYTGHAGQKVREIVGSSAPTVTVNNDQWKFVGWFKQKDMTTPYGQMVDTEMNKSNSLLVFEAKYKPLNASMDLTKEAKNTVDRTAGARIGDTIQYTVTVQNTGDAQLTNVKLSDTKFDKVTNLQVNGTAASLDAKKVLTISKIAANASAIVTYDYTVTEDDEKDIEIQNTVTAFADQVGEKTAKTQTSVEQRQEIKLHYAFEQVNGLNTTYEFAEPPLIVTRKYAGETVTKDDFMDALEQIEKQYPDGITGAGSKFNRDGEGVTDEIGTYEVSDETDKNNFAIKFPLTRHTLTYHPGAHGTLAPAAEATGGKLENGSVVFTVPYGATPSQWFTGDNGTLNVTRTAADGYVFDGWDSPFDLAQPVTRNWETTAKWRTRTAVDDNYMVIIYQNGVEIDRRNDFTLNFAPGEGAASATLTLDADKLLQQEQAEGKASQGYKFGRYTVEGTAGEITTPTHTFTITNGTTIHVYYLPYDLAVWHVRDGAPAIFDQAQSVPTLTAPATAAANTGIFGLSRMRYSSTEVAINGVKDEAAYTDTVAVPVNSGSYAVTFHYYRTSGGSGGNGGGSGGGNGSNGGTTIMDEEIPLAPGLVKDDHFAYVVGYPDGTVRPNANIDRQETATIFFRLMQDSSRMENWSQTNSYQDVQASQWSNNAISTMSAAGMLTGYEDGTFRPSAPITRGEFAAIAARFDSALYVGSDMFSDIAGHWAAPYINRAAQKGWIKGYEDGTFKPDQYITRAEAMTLVNAVLDRRVHAENILEAAIAWPDNPKDAWHYAAVQEATNSHDYDRATPTDYETWTALKPARDWTLLEKQWSAAAALPSA